MSVDFFYTKITYSTHVAYLNMHYLDDYKAAPVAQDDGDGDGEHGQDREETAEPETAGPEPDGQDPAPGEQVHAISSHDLNE